MVPTRTSPPSATAGDESPTASGLASPSAAPPSAAPRRSVQGFLAGVRATIYRREAIRAVLLAVAACSGITLTLPLVALVSGDSRFATTAVLTSGAIVMSMVVLIAIGNGVIGPRRRFGADRELARWVGRRHPAVASDLLSSVELPASLDTPWAPSLELVSALRATTASRLNAISPGTLFSPRSISRAAKCAVGGIAANVALLAVAPSAIRAGWSQLVTPPERPFDGAELSGIPLVGDLEVTLAAPAYAKRSPTTFASTSGDVRGLPGTTVALKGRLLVPATSAEVLVELPPHSLPPRQGLPWLDPSSGGAMTTIPATVDNAGNVTAALTIERSARYRFSIRSPAGRSVEAITRSIEAEIDLAPTVQLTAPNDPLEIANVKTVEVGYSIEDDFSVTSAELIWEAGATAGRQGDRGRKPLPIGPAGEGAPRIQGKLMWDLAEINVASGGEVRYWIEAKDNDSVAGPNIGKSRVGHLRVVSPRARHEDALVRQQQVAEKFLVNLGSRLAGTEDTVTAREAMSHQLREAIAELRSVAAAFERDPHASDAMRKALSAIPERLERLAMIEQRSIQSATPKDLPLLTQKSRPLIAELEESTLTLADWLDRERVESLLDIADEIRARHKRLADLLAQAARTKQPRLAEDIEREIRALDRAYGELTKHRASMPEDVLDQYIHRDAIKPESGMSCIADVASLVRAKKHAAAQGKLDACQQQQQRSISSLEGSLARVRGDKFSDEQNKLDEVMNTLADIAKDQDDVATESGRFYESYAQKANELSRNHRREATAKLGTFIEKTRRYVDTTDDTGLTPFATEELDIVVRRVTDVERMVNDGDLAEALTMARQARSGLDAISAELGSALEDDPKSKWVEATRRALDSIEKTRSTLKDLVGELTALSPRPEQIMSGDEQRTLDRLRRRQGVTEQRAKRLSERIKQWGGELPGDAAHELGKRIALATDHMTKASDRMKVKDPSGARESTRAAADQLTKARDNARSAARQAQHSDIDDEPIRIPGIEEHRTSERFREDLLEAMKHKSAKAPEGYDAMIKHYYQDLAK